ncbi:hypothetical protein ACIGEP_07280 [Microbacterium sp. NPDC077663]|uniref:hypothetical protein n=1 Tax=Microbacterium sp. NPDC077663 TaxID=3364189 RepID=UPI0037C653F3
MIATTFARALLAGIEHETELCHLPDEGDEHSVLRETAPEPLERALASCEILLIVIAGVTPTAERRSICKALSLLPVDALNGVAAIPLVIGQRHQAPTDSRRISIGEALLDRGATVLGRTLRIGSAGDHDLGFRLEGSAHSYRTALSHVGATAAAFPTTLIP